LSCTAAARCWATACCPSSYFRVQPSCCLRGAPPLLRPPSSVTALTARATPRGLRRGAAVCTLGAFATLWSSSTASSLLTKIVPALEVRRGPCARARRNAQHVPFPCHADARRAVASQGQRALVAYPCFLVYGLFALLTLG
jgi:hypothetical protein